MHTIHHTDRNGNTLVETPRWQLMQWYACVSDQADDGTWRHRYGVAWHDEEGYDFWFLEDVEGLDQPEHVSWVEIAMGGRVDLVNLTRLANGQGVLCGRAQG